MAKQPTKQSTHSWAVYHLKGTPAKLVGIVDDQPDEAAAIKDYDVPSNERGRLIAQRRASMKKPGAVSRPRTAREFQFQESTDLGTCVKRLGSGPIN
jgi:hypothetical protein